MTSSLRDAKFNDQWRQVFKKNYPFRLNEISMSKGDIFYDLKLNLNGNLNAIIGRNGVGKTNFLRSIFNFISSDVESNRKKFNTLLDENEINITYSDSEIGEEKVATNEDFIGFIFDPCSLIPELQKLFFSQENLHELLDGYELVVFEPEKLKVINYLCNSNYSQVAVYNLEEEYDDFPILPIFKVQRDSLEYDSRVMGLGELSMLYFFWLLDYVSRVEKKIILIVEEPESFISPLVQSRFINLLVRNVFENNIFCLISTHSEHVINRFPVENLKKMVFTPHTNEYSFLDLKNLEVLNTLGLSIPKKGILFFEDNAAKIFLKELLKSSKVHSVENFYFCCSGDESTVIKHVKQLPSDLLDFKFIAVFDGDGRGRVEKHLKNNEKYVFLPSELAPELHIMEFIGKCNFDIIAKKLHLERQRLDDAFQTASGLDHHEYFRTISKILCIDFNHFFSILCGAWIEDKSYLKDVEDFISKFEQCLILK